MPKTPFGKSGHIYVHYCMIVVKSRISDKIDSYQFRFNVAVILLMNDYKDTIYTIIKDMVVANIDIGFR